MSDGELKYPEWQAPLQDLIPESDREKLRKKIQEVETLIRGCSSVRGATATNETQAINDALSLLRIIKRNQLNS